MTYEAEVRADSVTTKRQLRTIEMKTLKTIAGYLLWDRQTNKYVRERYGVEDVVQWARRKMREWNEYISRMPDTRLAKIVRDKTGRSKTFRKTI